MARIMVVEDEPVTAMDLEQMLVAVGHEVVGWADAGEDAVEKARSLAPDLVLMDIRLQGEMTGIEASARIREVAAREAASVPIVFLTAFADPETVDRACETSPYGYLVKPFTERTVAAAVQVALARRDAEREAREREALLRSAVGSVSDALIAVDAAGRVRFANASALSCLEAEEANLIGRQPALSLLDAATRAPLDLLRRALEGEVLSSKARLCAASGEREVECSAGPVLGDDGRTLGAVLVFRDVGAPSPRAQHDINGPLTTSLVGIGAALRELDALRALRSVADRAGDGPRRATEELAILARIEGALRSAEEGASRVAAIMRALRASSLPAVAPAAPAALREARAHVLVIDDEPLIGRILEVTLRPRYDVTVVSSAERGLELIEGGATFDVVLSDLTMPGMSGRELYEHLLARHPDLARRMIVMSGGARDARGVAFLESMAGRRLDKPFRADELEPLIARCIGARRTTASA
ncbi:MAG: response regulator [Myxococcales bacterium]|nr:response regulator [Myxococcales bacterium]